MQVEIVNDNNFRLGSLQGDEILRWVKSLDSMPLGYPDHEHKRIGKIRILVCERPRYAPLDLPMSRSIFEEAERIFHLHPVTLPSFESHTGTFSRYLTFDKAHPTRLKRICAFFFPSSICLVTDLASRNFKSSTETRNSELWPLSNPRCRIMHHHGVHVWCRDTPRATGTQKLNRKAISRSRTL